MAETQLLAAEQLMDLLDVAVDQAKEAVLITSAQLDPPGPEILFVNPALCAMTGYSREEILHKTPRMLQGPKSDRAMLKSLRDALSRGETFSGETVNYRKDGAEYYVEWDITPIRAGSGEIIHFLSIQRNVTARKLAEDQLREMYRQVERSRNDLGSILNELRIGAVMTDENSQAVFLNAAARRLFGRPERAATHLPWQELFSLDSENTRNLQALIERPMAERNRIPLHLDGTGGRRLGSKPM